MRDANRPSVRATPASQLIPLKYNLRSLVVRKTTSLMTAAGVAMVVMIVVLLLSLVGGLRASLELAVEPHNWMVLSRGTSSEVESYIPREQYDVLRTRKEIATDASGAALISPEMVASFNAAVRRPAQQFQPAYLRGVYPIAYLVHKNLKLTAGRWPAPGREEMAIGRKQAERFPELGIGSTFRYGRRNWTIVGVFSDHGSARESEFWTDLDVLEQDARFENAYSSIHVVLNPGMQDSFRDALSKNVQLTVDLMSERDFYASQAVLADHLRSLVMIVALIVGIGATFGGMNTMYAAVAHRSREVGVLRALGFKRSQVLTSFLVESVIIALAGGLAGIVAALAVSIATALGDRQLRVGAILFSSHFSWMIFVEGILTAIAIGIAGGILPAWRAGRIGVIDSLREA
ncbi:MAG TPA: ABC transporter permease [Candidatus Binataceae bacterium]|nr:ABC transporter permease [Candidatus Binataceae bacterium]